MKLRKCPKWQYISLKTKAGTEYITESRCKSWRCSICRKTKFNEVMVKMEYGCLMLPESYLITLTRKAGITPENTADSVSLAFAAWLRILKKRHNLNLKWFKVIELTKQGTPHLHLIAGINGFQGKDSCVKKDKSGNKLYSRSWLKKDDGCLAHIMGKVWLEVTQNSFIVDVEEIYNPAGAAAYLLKYLTKSFLHRYELEEMGFLRRYSASRNWPREPAGMLLGTELDKWDKTTQLGTWDTWGTKRIAAKRDKDRAYMQPTGRSIIGDEIRANRKAKAILKEAERIMKNVASSQQARTEPD